MYGAQRVIERERYCPRCRRHVLGRERQFRMSEHLAGVFLTCGLYLPIFVLLVMLHGAKDPFHCPRCGRVIEKSGLRILLVFGVWAALVYFLVKLAMQFAD